MSLARLPYLLLAVASLAGCRLLLDTTALRKEHALFTPAPVPIFVRTHDSDAWVRETFHVQQRYCTISMRPPAGLDLDAWAVPP